MNDVDARPLPNCTKPRTVMEILNLFSLELGSSNNRNMPRMLPGIKPSAYSLIVKWNRFLALTDVNTTAVRVLNLLVATQRMVTIMIAATAVILMAHWGIESGDTSALVLCQKRRFRYSAKIRPITAFPPRREEQS